LGAVCSFNFLRILPLMLFGSLVLCALILCRSFCTPGRYIGSVGFRMWILVQSGMLSCGLSYQVPEKLYLCQNLKQHVMKEQRSAYKSYIEKIILNLLLNDPDQFKPKKLSYIYKILTHRKKTGIGVVKFSMKIS
jgi:hypothetical protein